ncbi:hypothetical protein CEXT_250061 [Caerostris extrusa]|uniref:Uncharacterized protein n=1 Tax=Caerostris extrusa TaxID=172846 RepID=A0AAV4XG68_CAEEX|nr:hypothetical protein CEXT_250061 [Caerostris extrusa]
MKKGFSTSLAKIQNITTVKLKLPSTLLVEDTDMKIIQLSCTSKESHLHVGEVIIELPSTSTKSLSQFHTKGQDMVSHSRHGLYCLAKNSIRRSQV